MTPSFARHGRPFRYPRGAVIFVQRDQATKLYLVVEGLVKLSIFTEQGEERIIEFIRPYRFLGAPDVFSGSHYGITATAYTEVTVTYFTPEQVRELLTSDQGFMSSLIHSLSQHARALGRQLIGDTFFPATGRVGFALLNLAVQIGTPADGEGITLPITQNELARYAGCNRITVTNALSELAAAGLISKKKGYLRVTDLPSLRQWLEEIARV
jgi:CRP-like cAMP-binding protein